MSSIAASRSDPAATKTPPSSAERRRLAGALFRPRGVALIGATEEPGRAAARPLEFLRRHGYRGAIYPINPRRQTVLGETCYPGLDAVPGPVDHAYILTGVEQAVRAVAECGRHGVKAATLIAGGFAEAGEAGMQRQAALLEVARAGGVRLVGPNSLGVVDVHAGFALTANAAFRCERLLPGGLVALSHSGSLIGTLLSRGAARGIGFSKLVSVGNEADLDLGEIGTLALEDPESAAFLLFLETVRNPDSLAGFAAAARAAGKPVLAYVLGRSEIGRQLAVSHTGAMVGSFAALDAFLADHGIVRVDNLETLFEAPPLFRGGPTASRRVGVVTTTGGGAAMVVDRLGTLGIDIVPARAETLTPLADVGIKAEGQRILDVTLAGTRPDVMSRVLEALFAAPEFDLVLVVIGSSAQFYPELAVQPIVGAAANAEKPVAVFIVPEAAETLRLLAAAGIAAFRTPEACADAITALLKRRSVRAPATPGDLDAASRLVTAAAGVSLDEQDSLALFDALGIPVAAGQPFDGAAPSFDFPVVAKLRSPDIAHKSEAGGVEIGIKDLAALRAAADRIRARARAHDAAARIVGVTVQPQVAGLGEALVGFTRDPEVGPMVTVGAGGILAELIGDVAVRTAPVDRATARAMVGEVRAFRALAGYRGRPAGDLDALAEAIERLSWLAALDGRRVLEAEINPLIVKQAGDGVVAVDGLVRLEPPEGD